MTRIQFVVVALLVAILLVGLWGARTFGEFRDKLPENVFARRSIHGIETTWRSAAGANRVWSVAGEAENYHDWLEEHAAVVDLAQARFPLLAGR